MVEVGITSASASVGSTSVRLRAFFHQELLSLKIGQWQGSAPADPRRLCSAPGPLHRSERPDFHLLLTVRERLLSERQLLVLNRTFS